MFSQWLSEKHPAYHLTDWQQEVINIVFSQEQGSGKTSLIKLMAEYDESVSGLCARCGGKGTIRKVYHTEFEPCPDCSLD